MNFPLFLRS